MRSIQLIRQYDRIVNLIKDTKQFCGDNLEFQGHWGKYICVISAGFLENAIAEVYAEYISNSSSPIVSGFVQRTLEKVQNPKTSKFIEIARSFKNEWGEDMESFVQQNPDVKFSIDSIMQNRHLIAHGKTTSVSVVKIKDQLEHAIKIVDFIEAQCGY